MLNWLNWLAFQGLGHALETVAQVMHLAWLVIVVGLLLIVAYAVFAGWLRRPRGRPPLETLDAIGVDAYLSLEPLARRAWNSKLRRGNFSWTEFKRVNFSWRNFFSFRLNKWARMRMYAYFAILGSFMFSTYGPASLRNLTRIACRAIEMAMLGGISFTARYERALQAHSFQEAFLARYDANGDGGLDAAEARLLLRQTGLAPRDLTALCVKADLQRLVDAAHRVNMLPASVTYKLLDADGYNKGVAEDERRHKAFWAAAEPYMRYYWSAGELLTLDGWERGWGKFYERAYMLAELGYGLIGYPFGAPERPPDWLAPPMFRSEQYQLAHAQEIEAEQRRYEAKMEALIAARTAKQRSEDETLGAHYGPPDADPPPAQSSVFAPAER